MIGRGEDCSGKWNLFIFDLLLIPLSLYFFGSSTYYLLK